MREIDIRALVWGINARRGNVSIITPSSGVADPVIVIFSSGSLTAFQDDAFQDDAFQ